MAFKFDELTKYSKFWCDEMIYNYVVYYFMKIWLWSNFKNISKSFELKNGTVKIFLRELNKQRQTYWYSFTKNW